MNAIEDRLVSERLKRSVAIREVQQALNSLQREAVMVDWTKVLKASFTLLFVSYPGAGLIVHFGCDYVLAVALLNDLEGQGQRRLGSSGHDCKYADVRDCCWWCWAGEQVSH